MFIPPGVVASSLGDIRDHFGTNLHSAYSVRKLNAYSSFGFVIRRTVDDEEANLYYDDLGNISFTSVVSGFSSGSSAANLGQFMAASGYTDADSLGAVATARVVTWKDQSGNSRDATHATEGSQPLLVEDGVLKTEGGIITLDFLTDMLQQSDASDYSQPNTFMTVAKSNDTSGTRYLLDGDGSATDDRQILAHNSNYKKMHAGAWSDSSGDASDTDQHLWFLVFNGAGSLLHIDGGADVCAGDPGDRDISGLSIGGRYSGAQNWYGTIQEVLYFRGDQIAIRGDIEDDVNRYYSIY